MFIAIARSSLELGTSFNFFEVGALRFISDEQFTFCLTWYKYFNLYRYLHVWSKCHAIAYCRLPFL